MKKLTNIATQLGKKIDSATVPLLKFNVCLSEIIYIVVLIILQKIQKYPM